MKKLPILKIYRKGNFLHHLNKRLKLIHFEASKPNPKPITSPVEKLKDGQKLNGTALFSLAPSTEFDKLLIS